MAVAGPLAIMVLCIGPSISKEPLLPMAGAKDTIKLPVSESLKRAGLHCMAQYGSRIWAGPGMPGVGSGDYPRPNLVWPIIYAHDGAGRVRLQHPLFLGARAGFRRFPGPPFSPNKLPFRVAWPRTSGFSNGRTGAKSSMLTGTDPEQKGLNSVVKDVFFLKAP